MVFAVVASRGASLGEVLAAAAKDAPGDIRTPGTPPPPFGREAGVYAHDRWRGVIELPVPAPGPAGARHGGFWVNTATGVGRPQVQAAPALMHYKDSAREAVGMYGYVYELALRLRHDGEGSAPRRVRVLFSSHGGGNPTRYWDGLGLVDGEAIVLRHTPLARSTELAQLTLSPGEQRTLLFEAMVPGLASIPQGLIVESR